MSRCVQQERSSRGLQERDCGGAGLKKCDWLEQGCDRRDDTMASIAGGTSRKRSG